MAITTRRCGWLDMPPSPVSSATPAPGSTSRLPPRSSSISRRRPVASARAPYRCPRVKAPGGDREPAREVMGGRAHGPVSEVSSETKCMAVKSRRPHCRHARRHSTRRSSAACAENVVRVEVDVTPGLAVCHIVGLPDAALSEARERIRSAIRNWQLRVPSLQRPRSTCAAVGASGARVRRGHRVGITWHPGRYGHPGAPGPCSESCRWAVR